MSTTTIHYWPDDVWCDPTDLEYHLTYKSDDFVTISVLSSLFPAEIDEMVVALNRRVVLDVAEREAILNQDQPDFAAELSALMDDLGQDERADKRDERSVITLLVLVIIATAVIFGSLWLE